jgi:hypothetical protein
MTTFRLTSEERPNIIAYVLSLKGDERRLKALALPVILLIQRKARRSDRE